MDLTAILRELHAERKRIEKLIHTLERVVEPQPDLPSKPAKRRPVSPRKKKTS